MKNKSILLIIFALTAASPLLGQKILNPEYTPGKEHLKLALIPIFNEYGTFNDTILNHYYTKETKSIEAITPEECKNTITADPLLGKILEKIILKDYSKKEFKTYPNLNTLLEQEEIRAIKERFDNADLILIPIYINFKNMGIVTMGNAQFRMYDLNSGDFVYVCTVDGNVNITGKDAGKHLTSFLVSQSYDYYKDKFLKKLKPK